MISARDTAYSLLLATLVACSWLLSTQYNETDSTTIAIRHIPDTIITGMTVDVTDTQGRLHRRLQADTMHHYWDDGSHTLEHPVMTLYRENNAAWRIASDQGWVSPDKNTVKFTGAVKIDNQAVNTAEQTTIHTRDLTLKPQQETFHTVAAVRISRPGDVTTGTGMNGRLSPVLELHIKADVETHIRSLHPTDSTS